MVSRIRWKTPCQCAKDVCMPVRSSVAFCRFVVVSLTYNHHCDIHYAIDTGFTPMFWFIDNYVRRFGPVFVGFLISMMGLVVLITYLVIVPYEWVRSSSLKISVYFILGHWALLNLAFHYWMGLTTSPGHPSETHLIKAAVSICKHCIAPKPPRTHHCGVCQRCVLKMDHHCPWLDRCIGHYNHRYFYFTMFFMWLGCLLISLGAFPCFYDHFWNISESIPVAPWCSALNGTLPYASYACLKSISPRTMGKSKFVNSTVEEPQKLIYGVGVYNLIVIAYLTAVAMVLGLGCLLAWHTRLISRGETSIEHHINQMTAANFKKSGKLYRNPYDFGIRQNWRIFTGLNVSGRSFWTHVMLPSRHKPDGDGLTFATATMNQSDIDYLA